MDDTLRRGVDFAFRRVPRLGKSWRYVPLHQLPVGTLIRVETLEFDVSQAGDATTVWLGQDFDIEIGIWPAVFIYRDSALDDGMMVKPLSDLLAASSTFRANFDFRDSTMVAESAIIQKISILGTQYVLQNSDDPNPDPKPWRPKW